MAINQSFRHLFNHRGWGDLAREIPEFFLFRSSNTVGVTRLLLDGGLTQPRELLSQSSTGLCVGPVLREQSKFNKIQGFSEQNSKVSLCYIPALVLWRVKGRSSDAILGPQSAEAGTT